MLAAMIDLCKLIWWAFAGLFRVAGGTGGRNSRAPAPTECAPPQVPWPFGLLQHDRLVFVGMSTLAPNVLEALKIVKPETVLRWASRRVPGLLVLESSIAGRATEYSSRDSRPHSRDEHADDLEASQRR